MENEIDIPPVEAEATTDPAPNNRKEKILTLRLSEEEWNQVQILKSKPYYINMATFLRDALQHLYDSRTNKAGRAKS